MLWNIKTPVVLQFLVLLENIKLKEFYLILELVWVYFHIQFIKSLNLGELKPTSVTLLLADRFVNVHRGIVEDVLVQVDKFIYHVDFIVLDTQPIEACNSISIILGRPFLATYNALINYRNGLMKLSFRNMTLEMKIFNICK